MDAGFVLKIVLTVLFGLNVVATISMIGKPRRAITHGVAIFTWLMNLATVAALWRWL